MQLECQIVLLAKMVWKRPEIAKNVRVGPRVAGRCNLLTEAGRLAILVGGRPGAKGQHTSRYQWPVLAGYPESLNVTVKRNR